MQGNRFEFLEQHHLIDELLTVCCDAMEHLPPELWARMTAALAPFMTFVVPVLWGIQDADSGYNLTQEEREEVLRRFVVTYECTDSDWEALKQIAQDVLRERKRPWGDATNACKESFAGIRPSAGATL